MHGSSIDQLVQIAKIWHFFWWRRHCSSNLMIMMLLMLMMMKMIPVTCKRQVASDLLAHTKNRRKKIIFVGTFSFQLLHKSKKLFLTSSTNTRVYNDDDDEDNSCNLQEASSIWPLGKHNKISIWGERSTNTYWQRREKWKLKVKS